MPRRRLPVNATPYSYRCDAAVPGFADDRPIIVFDGICAMCSAFVQFILRHDCVGTYRFIPAQSPLGRALYVHFGLDPDNYQSNILLRDGRAFLKSEGSLMIVSGLGWPWSMAAMARLLPAAWRDGLYEASARNRFALFGRRQTCFLPEARFQGRFLA